MENHDADDDDDILDLGLDESETFADEPSSPPKPSAPVKNPTPVPSQAPPSIIENRHHGENSLGLPSFTGFCDPFTQFDCVATQLTHLHTSLTQSVDFIDFTW